MRIKRLVKLDEILAIKQDWEKILLTQKYITINYSFDWIYLLYKHFGTFENNYFLTIENGNEIIGFIPLITQKTRTLKIFPIHHLAFMQGFGLTDFSDFIIKNDSENIIDTFLEYLTENANTWQYLQLKYLTENLSNVDLIRDCLSKRSFPYFERVATQNLYVDLTLYKNWEAYKSSIGRNLRKELNKRMNKLKALKNWCYERNSDVETEKLVRVISDLYTRRQRQLGRGSYFRIPWLSDSLQK